MSRKKFKEYCRENIPDSVRTINILDEIKNFKSRYGKPPTIIFDFEWFLHKRFKSSIYNNRYNLVQRMFESFLQRIKEAGGQMMFIFVKNSNEKVIQRNLRLKEFDAHLKHGIDLLEMMSDNENDEDIENFLATHTVQVTEMLAIIYHKIAEKYGTVQGFYNVRNKSRAFYSSYFAKDGETLAIASTSVHHLLIDGTWSFWDLDTIDIDTLDITEYDKSVVWEHMQLTTENIPLFLFLVDQRISSFKYHKITNYFRGLPGNFYENIREFLSRQHFPLNIPKFLKEILKRSYDADILRVESALAHLDGKKKDIDDPGPFELYKNIFNCYSYSIFKNYAIHIATPYIDNIAFGKIDDYFDIVSPILRKVMGILLNEEFVARGSVKERQIEMRKRHGQDIEVHKVTPIYPKFKITNLWEILSWLIDWHPSNLDLSELPERYVLDIMILVYLVERQYLTAYDAMMIFQTLVDYYKGLVPDNFTYPKVDSKAYRIGYLFVEFQCIFDACMTSIGVKDLTNNLIFDGVYFQDIYRKNIENLNRFNEFEYINVNMLVEGMLQMIE